MKQQILTQVESENVLCTSLTELNAAVPHQTQSISVNKLKYFSFTTEAVYGYFAMGF